MAQHVPHVPFWQRKFYVHPIQRKYFFISYIPLLLCAFLLFLLFFIPVYSAFTGPAADLDKAATLDQINVLGVRIWLALFVSMLATGLLSFFITNKFAGPLYRIEQILRRVEGGDLPPSVRIRDRDDLQEFAGHLDSALRTITSALAAIKEHQALADKELAALQGKVKAGLNGEILPGLEEIGRHHGEVENILANFRLPTLQAPNPEPKE